MLYRVAIFLRRSATTNRFRAVLEGCLKIRALNEAVVSSGSFQEDTKFSGASLFSLTPARCCDQLDLIFVGVHNAYWRSRYDAFVNTVRASNCSKCIRVSKRMSKGLRWHAKTFVGSIKGKPRVGIVGSSNITRPAADVTTPFNYEADVVLWHADDSEVNAVMAAQVETQDGSHEVIVTSYEPGGRWIHA
jgi:hypothetical protein